MSVPGMLLVSESGVTSLASIPAASLDGKFIRVCFAGIAGATSVHLKVNGTTILTQGVNNIGDTFFDEVVFTWNSTNQDLNAQTWLFGTPSGPISINPANFTFSTDATHTVTTFAVFAI